MAGWRALAAYFENMWTAQALSILISFSTLCYGQTNLATINGDVTDPSSRAVPGASVKARNIETGAVRAVTSDPSGAYQLPGLTPGEYTIEVFAVGFATATRTTRLEVGQNLRVSFGLTIGEARTAIEAEGRADTLKTEDASIGEVVEAKSV